MKKCNSCSMEMESACDFSMGNTSNIYCTYCVDKSGYLLSYETILENNVQYFKSSKNLTANEAVKFVEELLQSQPAWKHLAKKNNQLDDNF